MSHPRVAVLVLGYNHRHTLEACLHSVLNQTRAPELLRYIDNASADGSADFVRQQFPTIDLRVNTTNTGYAGAYRDALAEVFAQDFDAAILLNPDTLVDPQWLATLVDGAFADDSVALAQPKVYLYDIATQTKTTRINTFGNCVHFLGFGYCGRYNQLDTPPVATNRHIIAASGASLLVKKTAYQKLPGLDADFFAYLEDQDLNWQAHLAGYHALLVADSLVWHQYDFEKKHWSNLKFYLLERNRLIFLLKHFECKTLLLIVPIAFIMEMGMIFDSIGRHYFLAKLRSYFAVLARLPKIGHARRIIQQTRRVSDHELFSLLSPAIESETVESPLLSIANRLLRWYYRLIARWI